MKFFVSHIALLLLSCLFHSRTADAEAAADARLFPRLRKARLVHSHHAHHPKVHRVIPPVVPVVAAQVLDSAPVPNNEVPAAPDLGSKGYPELPGVSSMLTSATEKAKTMGSEANVLQASIARAQQENEAKLAKQKHIYEKKLRVQETRNQAAIALNSKVSQHISKLQQENEVLKNTSTQIRETNLLMKSELIALADRLGSAKAFVAVAIDEASDKTGEARGVKSRKNVKQIGQSARRRSASQNETQDNDDDDEDDDDDDNTSPQHRRPRQANQTDDDDDDDDNDNNSTNGQSRRRNGQSFLELGQAVRRIKPEDEIAVEDDEDSASKMAKMDANDLLSALQKGVASLTAEEKKSEEHLKQMFVSDYKVGARRHAALLAEQKKLNATEASLESKQAELKSTKKKLEGTNAKSQKKLRSIGAFLQQLTQLATANPTEAMQLIDDLPKTVA